MDVEGRSPEQWMNEIYQRGVNLFYGEVGGVKRDVEAWLHEHDHTLYEHVWYVIEGMPEHVIKKYVEGRCSLHDLIHKYTPENLILHLELCEQGIAQAERLLSEAGLFCPQGDDHESTS